MKTILEMYGDVLIDVFVSLVLISLFVGLTFFANDDHILGQKLQAYFNAVNAQQSSADAYAVEQDATLDEAKSQSKAFGAAYDIGTVDEAVLFGEDNLVYKNEYNVYQLIDCVLGSGDNMADKHTSANGKYYMTLLGIYDANKKPLCAHLKTNYENCIILDDHWLIRQSGGTYLRDDAAICNLDTINKEYTIPDKDTIVAYNYEGHGIACDDFFFDLDKKTVTFLRSGTYLLRVNVYDNGTITKDFVSIKINTDDASNILTTP